MPTNYMTMISTNFPNVGCFCMGDPTVYSNVIWQNGDPMPSKITLDGMALPFYQDLVCNNIDVKRNQVLTGGYTDAGSILWDTGQEDIQNLAGVCTLIACGAITSSVTWRDANNVNHTLTPTELITLAGGMAVFTQTVYGVGWYHKANVNALTDVASVLAYDFSAGWPAN